MTFQILALDPAPFAPLFGLADADLAARGVVRHTADTSPGFPCRVSLRDAAVGETLLLLNFEHLAVASPYRSRHAIYVREGAVQAQLRIGEVPLVITRRLLSVRAFDGEGMMANAEVVEGGELAPLLEDWFADDPAVAHIDVHNARQGCFTARVMRA